jgi:hypothetical protein
MWWSDLALIFPEICGSKKVDRGLKIRSAISPVVMKVNRREYMNIVKGIMHNFTFNDNWDEWFQHNFFVNKKNKPNTISFNLDFPLINLYGINLYSQQPFFCLRA